MYSTHDRLYNTCNFFVDMCCLCFAVTNPCCLHLYSKKIEDVGVLQEDYIRFLNSLPMDLFESEIWNKFGHEFIAESDRRKVSFSYSSSVLFAAGCNCCMSVYAISFSIFLDIHSLFCSRSFCFLNVAI